MRVNYHPLHRASAGNGNFSRFLSRNNDEIYLISRLLLHEDIVCGVSWGSILVWGCGDILFEKEYVVVIENRLNFII